MANGSDHDAKQMHGTSAVVFIICILIANGPSYPTRLGRPLPLLISHLSVTVTAKPPHPHAQRPAPSTMTLFYPSYNLVPEEGWHDEL